MSLASEERTAICDEFEWSGPDRPTLCQRWNTRDLLAHLLVRERQPWAAPGIVLSALAPINERAMHGYADVPWQHMIDDLRAGPPAWSPYRVGKVDELVNGTEFFVHHEDVRRGEPDWTPRNPDPARDEELWALLGRSGRLLLFRRSPVGLLLRRLDGIEQVVRTGPGLVTVAGAPAELVLHAFGRDAARVEVSGAPAAVAAYRAAGRGL